MLHALEALEWRLPWWLLALPLAWLAWRAPVGATVVAPSLAVLPRDRASQAAHLALRAAAALAVAATVLALADPQAPPRTVERIGRGAEIVVLLDRSRSMDEKFADAPRGAAPKGTGPEAIDYYVRRGAGHGKETKGAVARRLLAAFAARRSDDRFALQVFSSIAIPVLPFTSQPQAVQAAIAAGNVGRGLSDTDIGLALESALTAFDGRPYTGSRIVMLVSDGGDHIDPAQRERIAWLAKRHRVGLYWLYIRSALSPGLMADADAPPAHADAVPEYFLHRFLGSIGVPYKAYQAENPDDLQRAIDDVDRLEKLPIVDRALQPRQSWAPVLLQVALASVALLLLGKTLEMTRWSPRAPAAGADDEATGAPTPAAARAADGRATQEPSRP